MEIRRERDYIRLTPNVIAREGYEGNLPTLTIKKKGGGILKYYRGSSLVFSDPLTKEDQRFLAELLL